MYYAVLPIDVSAGNSNSGLHAYAESALLAESSPRHVIMDVLDLDTARTRTKLFKSEVGSTVGVCGSRHPPHNEEHSWHLSPALSADPKLQTEGN